MKQKHKVEELRARYGIAAEWNVLDRMIEEVANFPGVKRTGLVWNDREVTVHLSKFCAWCGYTQDISLLLFNRDNRDFRQRLESNNIVKFVNTGQGWDWKKMQFDYTTRSIPLTTLYKAYLNSQLNSIEAVQSGLAVQPVQPLDPVGVQIATAALAGEKHITYKAKNHHTMHLFSVSHSRKPVTSDNAYLKALPTAQVEALFTVATGDLSAGVEKMAKQLYTIDSDAFIKGAKKVGVNGFRLSPEETVAMRADLGMTGKMVIGINRHLKTHTNLKNVLAGQKACDKVKPTQEVQSILSECVYSPGKGKADRTAENWYQDLLQVLVAELMERRHGQLKSLGVVQGQAGICIPCVLQGDYGGDLGKGDTKFMLEMILNKDNTVCKQVASIGGPEDDYLFRNSIIPHLNAGLEKLNTHRILIVHWEYHFDLLAVLGDKTEAAVERLHKENNGYGRRLCAIHARPQAQMVMVKLKDQANLPEIQAIQAQVKAATSRFTSAATKLRKRILKDEAVHAKEMMIAQAVEIVNAFRTAHHVV